jgi:hypothetical protein
MPGKSTGATVAAVTNDEGDTPTGLVEVKLDKRTPGPVEIRLQADRPRTGDNVDEPLELAGFEVLEAVRQWGFVGVQVVGDWQVIWGDIQGLRQVDEPIEGKSRDELLAVFEYSSQPCSLAVRVSPRRTRVSVQPQYLFNVQSRETRLTADLKYTIRGAKVRELIVAMPGWEIEEIGPPNVVNVDAAAIDDATKFAIPLAQPVNGDLAIIIKARRPLPTELLANGVQSIELEIPRPQAEVVSPASVIVHADDNVELTPRSGSIVGLTLRSGRPPLTMPGMQQDPLYYQADSSVARFVADFKVNPQSIGATAETRIDVDEGRLQVDQRLRYEVMYEPAEKLTLLVPRSIPLDKLEITLDRARLTPLPASDPATVDPPDQARVAIALGATRLGRFELGIKYDLTPDRLPQATSVPVVVPLVLPVGKQLKEHRVFVRGESGISISPRKSAWKLDDRSRQPTQRQDGLRLTTTEPLDKVELALTLQERTEASTLVERAWIQSWLTAQGRQDRVVWRVVTGERNLRVQLPPETALVGVQALLDGLPQEVVVDSQGQISIPLPASSGQMQHVVELRYQVPEVFKPGKTTIEPPALVPSAWVRRLYWELILPGQEHLLWEPAGFVNESQWRWMGGFWSRQPSLQDAQLADWIGSAANETPLPRGAHVYLLSSVGEFPSLSLWTARRSHVVFVASLVSLMIGLAVIHLSVIRKPAVLFVLAAAVGICGFISLDLTILLLQAAVLGVALSLISLLLYRWSQMQPTEPVTGSSAIPSRTASISTENSGEHSVTDLYYRTSGSTGGSTATAPMALPATSGEPSA